MQTRKIRAIVEDYQNKMFGFRNILALVDHAESKCFRDTVVAEYVGIQ